MLNKFIIMQQIVCKRNEWYYSQTSIRCCETTFQVLTMCRSGRSLWTQRDMISPSRKRRSAFVAIGAISEELLPNRPNVASCWWLHRHSSARKLTRDFIFSLSAAFSYNLNKNTLHNLCQSKQNTAQYHAKFIWVNNRDIFEFFCNDRESTYKKETPWENFLKIYTCNLKIVCL